MISQHVLIQRRRQRRKRQVDQFTIPMRQGFSRSLCDQQYLALSALYGPITGAIEVMCHEIYEITEAHCDTIMAAFQELLPVVRNCISILSGPDWAAEKHPYLLVMKLSALHRTLIEGLVPVANVRGQCRSGHLASDPTGSYWQLRSSVRDAVRGYQNLLLLLTQECDTISLPYASATA
jgi:hypothetical protein